MEEVVFNDIVLGIGLEVVAQQNKAEFVLCVDRIDSESPAYGIVERGDILVSVAGEAVELEAKDDFAETSFHYIIQSIIAHDRPLKLVFERSTEKDAHKIALEATEKAAPRHAHRWSVRSGFSSTEEILKKCSSPRSARRVSSLLSQLPQPLPVVIEDDASTTTDNKLSHGEEAAISQALDAYTDAAADLNTAQVACRDEALRDDDSLVSIDSQLQQCEHRLLELQSSIEPLERVKCQTRIASMQREQAENEATTLCRSHAKLLLLRDENTSSLKADTPILRSAAASIARRLGALSSSHLDISEFMQQAFDQDDSDSDSSEGQSSVASSLDEDNDDDEHPDDDDDRRGHYDGTAVLEATKMVAAALNAVEMTRRKEHALFERIESLSRSLMSTLFEVHQFEDERRFLLKRRRTLVDSQSARKVALATFRFLANCRLNQLEHLARSMEKEKRACSEANYDCEEATTLVKSPTVDVLNEPTLTPPAFFY